ncbi:undecaprenyl/decaprenyl-phosphate alpha-N-acetylglucosaminyl 1-phosphate transferase [Protaetiibacter sp. SSC-01]|uniref:MraY family glycosyltransferase n=1 Tax=Protaetiibacter sp. SSC-01 TaxID=2759943 RepID=UPI0016573013|nr:MraY family glycosyltransferase [Protaetiibacter sp. SSC-01]QNO38520.1 undecaprenyl/decaprenyl-phosphate alpha-N-acetylglucosaminyl 1-phosphate transferase [Protaetiibacter sp. SSC-01]
MRVIAYIATAGVAAIISFAFSMVIWKLSHRYRLYPKIRERDVHTRPTPRLGGAAMFLGVVAAFAVGALIPELAIVYSQPAHVWGLLGGALMIVLIGVADDIWDLDWLTKLAGQMLAAVLLAWSGIQFLSFPLPGIIVQLAPWQSLVITVFVIVLVMNAINFIDGLDGLVAGVAIIANGVFSVYVFVISSGPTGQSDYFNLAQLISAVLIGACLGFLPLNWHRARLFMGDAGALLTGLLMAASTIAVTGQIDPGALEETVGSARQFLPAFIPLLLPFAILIVPLLDFGLAVVRRLRAGKSPFTADRKHLHHRLLDMGHSHLHAVLILYGWTAAASIGMLLFLFIDTWWAALATLLGLVTCTLITLAPLSRRKAVEAAAQSTPTDAELARFDPLDAAAEDAPAPTADDAREVLEAIHEHDKEGTA